MQHIGSPSLDEHTLIADARAGDMEALGQLLEQYRCRLASFAYKRTRDYHRAEDLVQALFCKIIQKNSFEQFDPTKKVFTWLCGCLNHLMIDEHRSAGNRLPLINATAFRTVAAIYAGWEAADFNPCDQMEIQEMQQNILAEISRLSTPLRDTAEAVIVHEMSYKQAALDLNIAVGTVKSRLHAAREVLKERLQPLLEAA